MKQANLKRLIPTSHAESCGAIGIASPGGFGQIVAMEIAPSVTTAEERRILHAFGEQVHLHLTGEQTGGRYAQWQIASEHGIQFVAT